MPLASAPCAYRRRRISALLGCGNGAPSRGGRGAAGRRAMRSLDFLRRQPVWLGGAISHAMAGDRGSGRRVHAGPSATRLFVQWINHEPQAAHDRRSGRRRLGRRVLDCSGGCGAGEARRPPRSRRHASGRSRAEQHAVIAAQFGAPKNLNRPYTRHRLVKSEEEIDWLRIGAYFTDLGMAGLRDGLTSRPDRARTRRSGRARLRQARRRQFHSLHRRDADARAQSRRAAPVSLDAPRAEGRRRRRRDHRDVLGLSGAGAALVRVGRGADAALSRSARGGRRRVRRHHRRAQGRRHAGAGDRGVSASSSRPASPSSTICCTAMAAAICRRSSAAPTGRPARCRRSRSAPGRSSWCSQTW